MRMNAAYLNGAALGAAGFPLSGLGGTGTIEGLGKAPARKGSKGRARAGGSGAARGGDLARVVNAFVAGRKAEGSIDWPAHAGYEPTARYWTDGENLVVDGAVVAQRPRGISSKQIRICMDAKGALEAQAFLATDASAQTWLRRAWRDRLAAANLLLGALRAGVAVHEADDFMKGYLRERREVDSRWRLGARGRTSKAGPGVVQAGCMLVEISEAMRKRATVELIFRETERLMQHRLEQHGFPPAPIRTRAPRPTKLSKAELHALAHRTRLALAQGDTAMLQDAARRLRDAVLTNRSTYFTR